MPATSAKRFGAHHGLRATDVFGEVWRQTKEEPDDAGHRSMLEYASLIPEASTGPLDIAGFPYQLEPFYGDTIADAEEVVYMKSTQIGASTFLWRWAVRRADQFGETVIYFFPTTIHVTEFGDERLAPSIDASRYLQTRIPKGHAQRKTFKQIGLGNLQLRGMQSKAAVQAVAAQAVVIDEYDECPPQRIDEAEQRISGAEATGRVGRVRRSGRPSIPGYGIDAAYQESDRRKWFVTCAGCGEQQTVEFGENLRWRSAAGGEKVLRPGHDEFDVAKDVTEAWRACRSCNASLEGKPIMEGEWSATAHGLGRAPGYHVQRLIVPRTSLRKLVVNSRRRSLTGIENFHNADLGEAWAASDARLTDEDLARAGAQGRAPQHVYEGRFPVTLGLDVASERDLSCRTSEHLPDGTRKALRIWEPETFEEVAQAMRELRVHMACVDALPERRAARALQAEFPGRVLLVEYDDNPKADAWVLDEKRAIVRVNRTEAIDAMMDSIRTVRNIIQKPPPTNYLEQMKSPVRRVELDAKERPVRRYVPTGTQGDDYAHAETYDVVAAELLAAFTVVNEEEAQQGEVIEPDAPVNLGYGEIGYRGGFD